MGKVLDYLELVGRASGAELHTLFGIDEELYRLIGEKEVSVHVDPFGAKFYRFPYYHTKREEKDEDSQVKKLHKLQHERDRIVRYIRDHPGLNGGELIKKLRISSITFQRKIEELLDEGRVTRRRDGVSWIYNVKEGT